MNGNKSKLVSVSVLFINIQNVFWLGGKYVKLWFGFYCLVTPCLIKDIRCHVWPYFFSKLANHQIRHQTNIKWTVSLMTAYDHSSSCSGLACSYNFALLSSVSILHISFIRHHHFCFYKSV